MQRLKKDIQIIASQLYNPKVDKKNLLGLLKNEYSIEAIAAFLNRHDNHPIVRKYFYGDPFPKKIEKFGNSYFSHKCDFEKEISIMIFTFSKFHKEVTEFLILKQDFQRKFLLGSYEEAISILSLVESKFGYSLWWLENRFLIEEAIHGLEGNKDVLNRFNKENDNTYPAILAYFLSMRCENKISVANYNSQLQFFFQGLNTEFTTYLNFRLDFLNNLQAFTSLNDIISYDSIFSLVDRYETFIKICQLVIAGINYSEERSIIKKFILKLRDKIDDPLLENLLYSYGVKQISTDYEFQPKDINIYEEYTKGNYEESCSESLNLIKKFPDEIPYAEILIKSLLYDGKGTNEILLERSLIQEILYNLYNLFSQNESYSKSLKRIQKLISVYENTAWARQLFSLIESEINKNKNIEYEKLSQLNSFRNNPFFYKIFPTIEEQIAFFDILLAKGDLIVIRLFEVLQQAKKREDLEVLRQFDIPTYRRLLYTAKTYVSLGNEIDGVAIYENILNEFPAYVVLYQEALHSLLNCYLSINDFNSFLKLYVVNYFKGIYLKIPPEEVHRKIEGIRFKGIEKSIFLPLFYSLTSNNNHIINLTVRHFLRSYSCNIPTEIIHVKESLEVHHLIYFLRHICTQEILKYFTFFTGTKEILNERLGICRILLTLDKENEHIYNEEIGSIAKTIVILEGMRQVDESKIFVDEKGLRLNELRETRNYFERYLSIYEIFEKGNVVFVDLSSLKTFLSNLQFGKGDNERLEKLTQDGNVMYSYFKEIFLSIRDKFLFNSKYGLDTYLSTRIRHGTLLGQIRSRFQDYHLITQKDEAGNYFENDYWAKKVPIEAPEVQKSFQNSLSNFSGKIDALISELKNDLIQIRTEYKVNPGLFDYIYPDLVLYRIFNIEFKTINNYEIFLDNVFRTLWNQTNSNLSLIREYIGSNVKDQYIKVLDELENSLKTLVIEPKSIQELINNIIRCKTNIIWELERISDWFQIKETNVKDFSIDKAIDTSIEITNRISEEVKILNITKRINSFTILKGSNFISYFDLLRIFFDNIIKYSGNASDELEVTISVDEVGRFMHIIIVNNLNDISGENITYIKEIFDRKREDLNSPEWDMERIKKEGSTGFYKAKKILVADLQSEDNSFDFIINESNEIEISIYIKLN